LKKGKPESGNIWVSISSKNNSFRMTFKDDGKRLDLETIKVKLLLLKKRKNNRTIIYPAVKNF
jgi:chemotaxis protein histidine kinase CheA